MLLSKLLTYNCVKLQCLAIKFSITAVFAVFYVLDSRPIITLACRIPDGCNMGGDDDVKHFTGIERDANTTAHA